MSSEGSQKRLNRKAPKFTKEHLYGMLWPFGIFRGKWRGRGPTGEHRLWTRIKVLLHFLNMGIRRKILYEPLGPWGHFPSCSEPEEIDNEENLDDFVIDDVEYEDERETQPEPIPVPPLRRKKTIPNTRLTRQQENDLAAEMGLSSQQLFNLRND